jgi:hypothetical protein
MNELDIICKCGHNENLHFDNAIVSGCYGQDGFCIRNKLFITGEIKWVNKCYCEGYKADNLLTIEVLAKQKGLI